MQAKGGAPMEKWLGRIIFASLAVVGLAAPDAKLAGQDVRTTVYGGAGISNLDNPFGTGGMRIDVNRTWGAYGRIARRVDAMEDCTVSLPPYCRYPEGVAREYALGVSRMGGAGAWRTVAAAGGGVLHWQREADRFLDASAYVGRPLNTRASLVLGMQAVFVPGLERQRREYNPVVEKKNVLLLDALAGLRIQVW
jgi:hypothetical protein